MPEQKEKLSIEDNIKKYLDGDAQKNALDFVMYLRENKISLQQKSMSSWKIVYKTFNVCFIEIKSNELHIVPLIGEYESDTLSIEKREIILANHRPCRPDCTGGNCRLKIFKIFGNQYCDGTCEASIRFINPTVNDIECIKNVIQIRRSEIKEGKAKKHVYIAMRNR